MVFIILHANFSYFSIMNERQRLELIIEKEGLTSKQFASEVGIQAGTISNILNGRNNPSLDVLQRVLNRFRTISSDWLILGVGSMYRPNGDMPQSTLFDIKPIENSGAQTAENTSYDDADSRNNTSATEKTDMNKREQPAKQPVASKEIDKILIFYTDGTFEER